MSDRQLPNQQPDFTRTIANQYDTVFVDVVGECNLRCVYCYQSDKNFKPHSGMSEAIIESVIPFANIYGRNSINVTSEGEFTFGKNWQTIAQRLQDSGLAVCMTSNLARMLNPDEVKTLSRFATICLSLDSTDRETLKSIRRSADIRTITHNVLQIRAAAIAEGRGPTPIVINCVLSTGNASRIPALVAYCSMFGAAVIIVSPLHAYGEFAFDKEQLGADRVDDPIETWDLEKLKELHNDFLKCVEIAKRGNATFGVNQSIAQRLIDKLNGAPPKEEVSPGLTRICTQPWDRAIVQSNGDVRPCCYGADIVGNIATQGFEGVVNGEKLIALKKSLLTGQDLQPQCRKCAGEPIGTTDQLKTKLQDYFQTRGLRTPKAG
jgi:radical SAM protein with 4Fe4S-binding SPASM domain